MPRKKVFDDRIYKADNDPNHIPVYIPDENEQKQRVNIIEIILQIFNVSAWLSAITALIVFISGKPIKDTFLERLLKRSNATYTWNDSFMSVGTYFMAAAVICSVLGLIIDLIRYRSNKIIPVKKSFIIIFLFSLIGVIALFTYSKFVPTR